MITEDEIVYQKYMNGKHINPSAYVNDNCKKLKIVVDKLIYNNVFTMEDDIFYCLNIIATKIGFREINRNQSDDNLFLILNEMEESIK